MRNSSEKTDRRVGAGVSAHAGGDGRCNGLLKAMKEMRDQQTQMQIHQLTDACLLAVAFWLAYSFVLILLKEELLRLVGNCKKRVC